MSDEERPNKGKQDKKDDSFFSDVLDALDKPVSDEASSPQAGVYQPDQSSIPAQPSVPQSLFPYAPDMNDPNAYPDFQGAKFYVDTRDYFKAISSLTNILRVQHATTDKNMASELVLELAKTDPSILDPLLPYLILVEDSADPIINMNINNSLLYLRVSYNNVVTRLKEIVKSFVESYYTQFNTTYIPFIDILTRIGTSIEVIIKILELMTKNRELTGKLDFAGQVFAYEPPGALYLCPHCGIELKKDANFCPNCLKEVFKCAICFRFIKPDELVRCPKCSIPAHEQHFLEWVKKTGACPSCQNKLYEQEVAKVQCIVCSLEIKSSEKVENLTKCPACGGIAHKDHFLDYIRMSNHCPECKKPIDYKELKKLLKKK
ncbi:MAG TPA: zinc-ribbon domain-containing protein [Candidatus Deferrimicrobium sp.]|nr:zinc-ribbon domain-containing protein [Candidatus Deferrimicrobium sp.]